MFFENLFTHFLFGRNFLVLRPSLPLHVSLTGLHVFPKFLVYQVSLLSVCTTVTVVVKFATCYCTLRLCVSSSDRARRYVGLVSAGLAQVSEFSFVLGSIARRLGLLSREVYLLILGVTTLSLLVAPILWKLFLYQANFDDVR